MGDENPMQMDNSTPDMEQPMGGSEDLNAETPMEGPNMDDQNMEPEMGGDMGSEAPSPESDSTMDIINQLSEKDKKAVEAYAESLLSSDETKNDQSNGEEEIMPDGLDMEQTVNESFIFTKKQLTKLMENFGPTNDELEKKDERNLSKMKKNTVRNSPFNSPRFK